MTGDDGADSGGEGLRTTVPKVNPYAAYVQSRMRDLELGPTEVESRGGPSKQVVSTIQNDTRHSLTRPPTRETVAGLAAALDNGYEGRLWGAIAQSMGLPVEVIASADLDSLSDDELLAEVRRRMRTERSVAAPPADLGERRNRRLPAKRAKKNAARAPGTESLGQQKRRKASEAGERADPPGPEGGA